jgi:hypothetical protein
MFAASPSATPLSRAIGLLGAAGALLIGTLALMQSLPPAVPEGALADPNENRRCTLRPAGFLRGRLFGALSLTVDWSGAELLCDGMQRPNGEGVRLFFARAQPGGDRVSVLIGIDGRPEDLVGPERSANVTVIDEKAGRFFSAGGPGRCWASINSVTVLPRSSGGHTGYRIDGLVYCVGALPSIGDRSSLTLSDLRFAGRVSSDEV